MAVAHTLDDERFAAITFDSDAAGPAVEAVHPRVQFESLIRLKRHGLDRELADRRFFLLDSKEKAESTLEEPESEKDDEGNGTEDRA